MRRQQPIGLATIYRALDALKLLGLVQHRVTLTGETLYSAVEHDHHYLTCLQWRRLSARQYLPSEGTRSAAPKNRVVSDLLPHAGIFWGLRSV